MSIKAAELRHIEKLSIKQVMFVIPVCHKTIYNWRAAGMPFHRYKTGVYYKLDEILEWMKCQPKLIELYLHVKSKLDD